jgi:very-short-patch-repair endonuclease
MHYYHPKLKQRSRELRNRSTLAEVLLWNQLKRRKMLGCSFLRQRPIHKYIVDFYCPRLKLVIEIDGESHRNKFHSDQPRERDLRSLGLWVLRFQDRDVKHDMGNVLRCIQSWIEQHVTENTERHTPTPPFKGGFGFPTASITGGISRDDHSSLRYEPFACELKR